MTRSPAVASHGGRSRFDTALVRRSIQIGQRSTAVTKTASRVTTGPTTSKARTFIDMHHVDDAPCLDLPTLQDICAGVVIVVLLIAAAYGLAGLTDAVEAARARP